MKNYNKISSSEKNRILEMYYSNQEINNINEQKLFSGIKANIKGFGKRLKTNIKNAISGAQGKKGEIKSPLLERDLAKLQSRASDLISTIEPFVQEIIQTKIVINSYPEVYGQEYVEDAKQVVGELSTLEEHIGKIRGVLEEFKQAGKVDNTGNNQSLTPDA